MRFSVPIINYGNPAYPNVACFVDYVRAVVAALRDLGHEVVPPTVDDPSLTGTGLLGARTDKSARPIVFGAQNMNSIDDPRDRGSFLPEDAILYNSEQTGARGADPRRIFDAVETWRKRVVWDYSQVNIEALRKLGCERLVHCPVGYHPSMTRITPLLAEDEDIDVLFYGSIEPPQRIAGLAQGGIRVMDRGDILNQLKRAGLIVKHVFGTYAEALDPWVQRAKIVLNLHYYSGAVFEIFRCSHLLANAKCIVTEDGGCDETLEEFAKSSMIYLPRRSLVDAVVMLARDAKTRQLWGARGQREFAKTSLADNLKRALEQS